MPKDCPWPTLAEMRRVLRPGGRLIASVQHPFVDYAIQDPRPDYSATTSYTADWVDLVGQAAPMTFWRRPLHAMTDAFTAAGFRLAVISEPQPDPAAREALPRRLPEPLDQNVLPVVRSGGAPGYRLGRVTSNQGRTPCITLPKGLSSAGRGRLRSAVPRRGVRDRVHVRQLETRSRLIHPSRYSHPAPPAPHPRD
jgi:hypothetical protein